VRLLSGLTVWFHRNTHGSKTEIEKRGVAFNPDEAKQIFADVFQKWGF
jgi:hypothetical protein